jgi:hypothetical protein
VLLCCTVVHAQDVLLLDQRFDSQQDEAW